MPDQTEQPTQNNENQVHSTGKLTRSPEDKRKNVWAVVITIVILIIIAFLVWFFGFRNNNSTNSATSVSSSQPDQAAQEAAIKSNWEKFFNGKTPVSQKVALLQNGSQFAPMADEYSQSKTAQATTATVTKVELTSPTTATVTYTINVNGTPVEQNQTGQAVLVNGNWLVSDATFCGLLELAGTTPPNCPKPGSSTNSSTPSQSGSSTTNMPNMSSSAQSTGSSKPTTQPSTSTTAK